MFKISDDAIRRNSPASVFIRGQDYYRRDRIRNINFSPEKLTFEAEVMAEDYHQVKIAFTPEGNLANARCTCKANIENWGFCKHVVAVLLIIKDRDEEGFFEQVKYKEVARRIFRFFENQPNIIKTPVELEVTYEFDRANYYSVGSYSCLTFKIGSEKAYVVKSVKKLMESISKGEELQYGKNFSFNPLVHTFKPEDMPVIDMLMEHYKTEQLHDNRYFAASRSSVFRDKQFAMSAPSLKRFFNIFRNRSFKAVINGRLYEHMRINESDFPVDFNLTREENSLLLTVNIEGESMPLTDDGEYFFAGNSIYKVSERQRQNFKPFYSTMVDQKSNKIRFLEEDRERFVSEILPFTEKAGNLVIDEKVQSIIEKIDLDAEIYLDRKNNDISAVVKFIYGDRVINPFTPTDRSMTAGGKVLVRDMEKERVILDLLGETSFIVRNNELVLEGEEKIFEFIYNSIPKLQEYVNIFYSESFKNMKLKSFSKYSGKIRLNTDTDMLEFTFDLDGIDRSEIASIFDSLREKRKYYRLKNGSYLSLESEPLKEFANIAEYLELDKKDFEKDVIEVSKFRALYLDQELRRAELHNIVRNNAFKELVQSVNEPADADIEVPGDLKDILRDYQKYGYKWLKTLAYYRMGGILADDMGLGKTLQVIALIASDKQDKGKCPSLIVVPTSLIYNWQAEVEKFAPYLDVTLISGNRDERLKQLAEARDADIVVTSYPLIRRDIDDYDNMVFRYCILDEAQHIKNPDSLNAKSVKQIKAEKRFALTGTPMENSLSELWSIFDFAMPGYLFNHNKFMQKYERPIVRSDDRNAIDDLRRHIRPFILRRLKIEVLKELPEKIEHKMIAELTDEQKKVYMGYMEKIRKEIDNEIREKGFEKSHIMIIAALTRLRQICCHPATFLDGFEGESGKMQLMQEIVQDSIEGGHRILLFSQFTSMLDIIRGWFDKENIGYLYLDGSTPAEERGKLVKDFNNGSGHVFLISLKAGGTGLNLTGADTVIHYDPWWNPAVEEQATDRAHRIGQQKSVHVMKLVTKGTIEEKIYDLQEKKRNLINAVIEPGETMLSRLTEAEIRELFML